MTGVRQGLLHGTTRRERAAEMFVLTCMPMWLLCVVGFTLAGSIPPDWLLVIAMATILAALACIVYLELQPATTSGPEAPGREPRAR